MATKQTIALRSGDSVHTTRDPGAHRLRHRITGLGDGEAATVDRVETDLGGLAGFDDHVVHFTDGTVCYSAAKAHWRLADN